MMKINFQIQRTKPLCSICMKKRIQIPILFPKELLKPGDNSLEADNLPSMYEVTPSPKQPRMFNWYSHKAGECFENKATSSQWLLPPSWQKHTTVMRLTPIMLPVSLRTALGINSKCPASCI